MIIVIFVPSIKQEAVVNEFLFSYSFGENVQVYLFQPREDCFNAKHLPINLMRNLAIRHVQTTHYVVFDMDVRLSRPPPTPSLSIAQLYATLQRVPPSVWKNRYSVVLIPVFFLDKDVVRVEDCASFKNCTLLCELEGSVEA